MKDQVFEYVVAALFFLLLVIGIGYQVLIARVESLLRRTAQWQKPLLFGRYDILRDIERFVRMRPQLNDEALQSSLKILNTLHRVVVLILLAIGAVLVAAIKQ